MFDEIKEKVKRLIEANKGEVTAHTNYRNGGLYMIYIDDFSDDKIIPFYIGQTNDFQERHKSHFTEILSLNRLRKDVYESCVLNGVYNSRYKSCKMYSYMVEKECELSDYHMVILEYIDNPGERENKEKEYIASLKAPFFGFNQMDCVSRMMEFGEGAAKNEEYLAIVKSDYESLCGYIDYGYCRFNMFVAYAIFVEIIDGFKETEMYQSICKIKKAEEEERELCNYINYDSKEEAKALLDDYIDSFFAEHRMKSEEKKGLAIDLLLFEERYEKRKKDLRNYFKRFHIDAEQDFLVLIKKQFEEPLKELVEEIKTKQKMREATENRVYEGREQYMRPIMPQKKYEAYPLGYMYRKYVFPENAEDNVCFVNIEYTCFRTDFNQDIYPEICNITYKMIKDGAIQEREVFIENQLTGCLEKEDVYYVPKRGFGIRNPFDLYLRGNVCTSIPTTMEYKNGINELLLSEKRAEDEKTVFEEIDKLIDKKTKVIYTASGAKSTILRYNMWKEELLIIRKLQRCCK